MRSGLLEMEKTLRDIKLMVKNKPILKNANIRGLAELWKSQRELQTDLLLPELLREDTMQTTSNGNLNASPKPWCWVLEDLLRMIVSILPRETILMEVIFLFLPASQM